MSLDFTSDPVGSCFLVVAALSALLVVCLIGYLLFQAVDKIGTRRRTTSGTVLGVSFQAAHTETSTMLMSTVDGDTVGTINIPTYTSVPDQWVLDIQCPEGSGSFVQTSKPRRGKQPGQSVRVTYKRGRLSRSFTIKSIQGT